MELLDVPTAIAACEEAYRQYGLERSVTSNPSTSFMVTNGAPASTFWIKGTHLAEPGVAGLFFGANFGNFYFMVVDAQDGSLQGMLEHSWVTKRRTGATAAVAAKWLGRKSSRIAALIGAGRIGEEVVRSISSVIELDEFRVASRTLEGARAFARRIQPEISVPIIPVGSAEEAAREADIVVTMTTAKEAFFKPGWLKQGALLLSMGGVPEIEYGVLGEIDRLFVDDVGYALLRGDLASWTEGGFMARADLEARIDGDIGQVVCGACEGRQDDDQRILAVIQGTAVCDLLVAKRVIERARENGVGQYWQVGQQQPRASTERPTVEQNTELLASRLSKRNATAT
jgi:ornithine cyclodeaminase